MEKRTVSVEINGSTYEKVVEPRLLLSDFIRHEAHLTGTHVGCEHGVCGACTIQLDGAAVRSCLLLAVQAHGRSIRTVESLAAGLPNGELHPLQQAFHETHALQAHRAAAVRSCLLLAVQAHGSLFMIVSSRSMGA